MDTWEVKNVKKARGEGNGEKEECRQGRMRTIKLKKVQRREWLLHLWPEVPLDWEQHTQTHKLKHTHTHTSIHPRLSPEDFFNSKLYILKFTVSNFFPSPKEKEGFWKKKEGNSWGLLTAPGKQDDDLPQATSWGSRVLLLETQKKLRKEETKGQAIPKKFASALTWFLSVSKKDVFL